MVTYPAFNKAVAISKSDTVDLDVISGAVYVGGAGVVAAVFQDGSVVNFTAVAGEILPIQIRRVNNTNTTATLMVALYQV